jgi:hypothetical protein
VAAPLFARIAEPALRRLAVPPDDPDRVLRATGRRAENIHFAAYDPAGQRHLRREAPSSPGPCRTSAGPPRAKAPPPPPASASSWSCAGRAAWSKQTPEPGTAIEAG